jgi:pimeloyl-ACP methyl ester carboxylesterase
VSEEVRLPAGTVRYREAGEGKPVVFVHGYLVDETPNARLVQIPDSKTFVSVDQPQRLADEIAAFVDAN